MSEFMRWKLHTEYHSDCTYPPRPRANNQTKRNFSACGPVNNVTTTDDPSHDPTRNIHQISFVLLIVVMRVFRFLHDPLLLHHEQWLVLFKKIRQQETLKLVHKQITVYIIANNASLLCLYQIFLEPSKLKKVLKWGVLYYPKCCTG